MKPTQFSHWAGTLLFAMAVVIAILGVRVPAKAVFAVPGAQDAAAQQRLAAALPPRFE